MPGGYIERDLVQFAPSVRYQPVNLMDLIRTRRLFGEGELDAILEQSFAFTQSSGLKDRWKELRGKEDDSLGFWAEALFHLCLMNPDIRCRAWLAEAMMDLEDNGLGLSPSLLGANAEAVSPGRQYPCPSPTDARLRLANLSREGRMELLVVNPGNAAVDLEWETPPADSMLWQEAGDKAPRGSQQRPSIPPRGWLHGMARSDGTGQP